MYEEGKEGRSEHAIMWQTGVITITKVEPQQTL